MPLQYDPTDAVAALSRADAKLARLIERVGAFDVDADETWSPFPHLLRRIVYQQLSGKAAAAIHARLLGSFSRPSRPGPKQLLAMTDETLRNAGLSRSKIASARELAQRTLDGTVPTRKQLERMDDEEIVARLTRVRGIGPWSVEMILIFQLGRPDVLPVTDLGVRKGYMISHGGQSLPEPKRLARYGERWRPYRSVAAWYLWQANDL